MSLQRLSCLAHATAPGRPVTGARLPAWGLPVMYALLAGHVAPAPAAAQDAAADARAADMIEESRHYYGVARSVSGCAAPSDPDEIVVCARRRPDPRYAPPAPPLPPDNKTLALGAPPVGGGFGASVSVRGCFLQKCPKQLYFIDLKAIPEPAPGSEAYAIAHGEAPAR